MSQALSHNQNKNRCFGYVFDNYTEWYVLLAARDISYQTSKEFYITDIQIFSQTKFVKAEITKNEIQMLTRAITA